MQQHIGIRVAIQSLGRWNDDTAQRQRTTGSEAVDVIAQADPGDDDRRAG